MRRRLSWVLIALSGLALLAGCGQSEKQQYTSKMKSIFKQSAKEERQISAGNAQTSFPGLVGQTKRLQGTVNRLTQRLAAVKPPSQVKDLHARFTALFRNFAVSIEPAIQAADSGDLKRFKAATLALNAGAAAFQAQVVSLNSQFASRGYKLT